jgi:hypothetical protein
MAHRTLPIANLCGDDYRKAALLDMKRVTGMWEGVSASPLKAARPALGSGGETPPLPDRISPPLGSVNPPCWRHRGWSPYS